MQVSWHATSFTKIFCKVDFKAIIFEWTNYCKDICDSYMSTVLVVGKLRIYNFHSATGWEVEIFHDYFYFFQLHMFMSN